MSEAPDRRVARFLWAYWLAVAAVFGAALVLVWCLAVGWDLGPSFG